MSGLKSLRLALDVATTRRDEAGHALGHQNQRLAAARLQSEQLESYAVETSARWAPSTRAQPSPESVFHYYQFMDKLQQAIDLQHQVGSGIAREVEMARQQLTQAELRIASLKQLLDIRMAALARAQSVRDQKQTDEFAATAYRRSRATLEL